MKEQVRVQKTKTERTSESAQPQPTKSEQHEKLKEELDDLLDEIDGVLQENAEEFIKAYIQKGGQAVTTFLRKVRDGFGITMFEMQNKLILHITNLW